jgi:hypothetical protein
MLQCCNQIISLQIIKTSVELNEEYEVENILKRMISEKFTISSNEKIMISQKTSENSRRISRTVQEHFDVLRRD